MVDYQNAAVFFTEVQSELEKLLQLQLENSGGESEIRRQLSHLQDIELKHSRLIRAFNRLTVAAGGFIDPKASIERPADMARAIRSLIDKRMGEIGPRLRVEEYRTFYLDALLGVLVAYHEVDQAEYDRWVANKREHPFFNRELSPSFD